MGSQTGKSIAGSEFFELLCADDLFCAELGRVVLAAGRLETTLKCYLASKELGKGTTKATLGQLICYCKDHDCLTAMLPALEGLIGQRNYLMHNLHALLSDLIEETILERAGLLDSDVSTYIDRAWELRNDLNEIARIIESADDT